MSIEDLISEWLVRKGIGWLESPKCSQCWSASNVYETKCCTSRICMTCARNYLSEEGWLVFRQTVFTCPRCGKKIS